MKKLLIIIFLFQIAVSQVFAYSEYPYGICYDKENKNYFVTYIAGDPAKKNSNGYVSRLDDKLKVIDKYYLIGLNAPRGIIIAEKKIVICDLNEIKIYDKNSKEKEKIIKTGKFGTSMITDICYVKKENKIYVSDMLANKIISLDLNNDYKIKTLHQGSWLKFPSSVAYDKQKNRLLVSNFFYGTIFSIKINNSKEIKTLLKYSIEQVNGLAISNKGKIYIAGGTKQGSLFEFDGKELVLLEYLPDIPGNILITEDNKSLLTTIQYQDKICITELFKKNKKPKTI